MSSVSCPGRASGSERRSGPQGDPTNGSAGRQPSCGPWVHASRVTRLACTHVPISGRPEIGVSLRSPGTRERGARPRGSRMSRWPWRHSRCQTAQSSSFPRRVVAPGFGPCDRVHPPRSPKERGGRSADRRTCLVVAFARRDGSALVRRGASHDAGRSPLGAPPWRFSAGGRASISGISSGSVQRAPRSQVIMPGGRCPGPPESAVTSRGRRTPLPAPPSGSSLEDAPP